MLESKSSNTNGTEGKDWTEMEKAISQEGGPYNPEAEILKWVVSQLETKAKHFDDTANMHLDSAAKLTGLDMHDASTRQYHRGCCRTYFAAAIHLRAIFTDLQASLDALAKRMPGPLIGVAISCSVFAGCINPVEGRYGVAAYVPKQDSCWISKRVTQTRQESIRGLCDQKEHEIEWIIE